MEELVKSIQEKLNKKYLASMFYEVDLFEDTERHWWLPSIKLTTHGVTHTIMITKDLFLSADYRRICEFGSKIVHLVKPGSFVEREGKKQIIEDFDQAMEWLINEAKKGQNIQRYKGLGEMNPDQLWETTMDPERRVLLRVRVEDAVAADQIFTTLMGDEVEPRRLFIETNALEAENIDI